MHAPREPVRRRFSAIESEQVVSHNATPRSDGEAIVSTRSSSDLFGQRPLERRAPTLLVEHGEGSSSLASMLALLGRAPVVAHDRQEAVRAFDREQPALIVIDLEHLGSDGFQTAIALRQEMRGRRVPIVLVDAKQDRAAVLRGHSVGAIDCLSKPLDQEVFVAKLASILQLHRPVESAAREDGMGRSGDAVEVPALVAETGDRAFDREVSARESAERAVKFNELFLGMLGHDLRNPMSAVSMGARLLLRANLPEKETNVARRIVHSSERMGRMVDQLLDFTRIRSGSGLGLSLEPCDLESLARRVVEELETGRPGVQISLEATGDTTGTWDADRLLQAFSNLIGNALDHGGRDREVRVRVAGEGDRVSFSVENAGAIPEQIRSVIFDPFRGTQRKEHRKEQRGLGLGLYITEQIVLAHSGSIGVRSSVRLEEGTTTFRVELPRTVPLSRADVDPPQTPSDAGRAEP